MSIARQGESTAKFSEAAAKVIALAQVIRSYWNEELPKRHPNYPIVDPFEDSGPPPPEEAELEEFLEGLPPNWIYQLILVMYLGRGDFGTPDLPAQFEYVKTMFRKPEWAISQMMGKGPLPRYLANGLDRLKRDKINP